MRTGWFNCLILWSYAGDMKFDDFLLPPAAVEPWETLGTSVLSTFDMIKKDLCDISSIVWCAVVGNGFDVTCCTDLCIPHKTKREHVAGTS
jgi:hypothetical protein